MRTLIVRLAAALTALTLAASACGSDSTESATDQPPTSATDATEQDTDESPDDSAADDSAADDSAADDSGSGESEYCALSNTYNEDIGFPPLSDPAGLEAYYQDLLDGFAKMRPPPPPNYTKRSMSSVKTSRKSPAFSRRQAGTRSRRGPPSMPSRTIRRWTPR